MMQYSPLPFSHPHKGIFQTPPHTPISTPTAPPDIVKDYVSSKKRKHRMIIRDGPTLQNEDNINDAHHLFIPFLLESSKKMQEGEIEGDETGCDFDEEEEKENMCDSKIDLYSKKQAEEGTAVNTLGTKVMMLDSNEGIENSSKIFRAIQEHEKVPSPFKLNVRQRLVHPFEEYTSPTSQERYSIDNIGGSSRLEQKSEEKEYYEEHLLSSAHLYPRSPKGAKELLFDYSNKRHLL